MVVETVTNWRSEARRIPIPPPIEASRSDSKRKAPRMLRRGKPRARIVPISVVRLATEAYIVIIAPIIAPRLKITVTKSPSTRIKVAIISDCSA